MANLRKIEKAIRESGFYVKREAQGHVVYEHADGRTFTMPDLGRSKERRQLDSGNSIHLLLKMLRKNGVNV